MRCGERRCQIFMYRLVYHDLSILRVCAWMWVYKYIYIYICYICISICIQRYLGVIAIATICHNVWVCSQYVLALLSTGVFSDLVYQSVELKICRASTPLQPLESHWSFTDKVWQPIIRRCSHSAALNSPSRRGKTVKIKRKNNNGYESRSRLEQPCLMCFFKISNPSHNWHHPPCKPHTMLDVTQFSTPERCSLVKLTPHNH
jgi:hypothetical protein